MAQLSMKTVLSFMLCLLCAVAVASPTSFFAIDLGSEYLKVSVVKPGKIPISIVVNELSKRKTPALVGHVDGQRVIGEEAASLLARYPDKIFSRLRDLLGRPPSDPAIQSLFLDHPGRPYTLETANNRSTSTALQIPTSPSSSSSPEILTYYTAEELVGSLLEYAATIASAAAESHNLRDCVIVVPAWFNPAQRAALYDAASLAGLNVMGLIHSHAAAALQYGIERDFADKTENVIFYDLGAGSLEVALVTYSSYNTTAGKVISQFEVKDVAWIEHHGGDVVEGALTKHLAAQFTDGDVLNTPRAYAKLAKQAKRAKEILSANTAAPVSVEELLNDKDFRASVDRDTFEHLGGTFWERAVQPVLTLMERNNLTVADLSAFELLGGSSRIPRVKTVLSQALGGRALDMHLDADEAVAMGAGLFAANISTGFRLRPFGMTDKVPFGVTFENLTPESENNNSIEGGSGSTEQGGQRVIVPAMKKMPTKRTISLTNVTNTDHITFKLTHDSKPGAILPCCQKRLALGEYTITGLNSLVEKYGYTGKVSLHTVVDDSGRFSVSKADAAVEYYETVEVVLPTNVTLTEDGKNSTGSTNNGTDNGTDSTTSKEEGAKEKAAPADEKAPITPTPTSQKVTHLKHIKVPLNMTTTGAPESMSKDQLSASRGVLRKLREADALRRETARNRNDLEAYIINFRDVILSADGYEDNGGTGSGTDDVDDLFGSNGNPSPAALANVTTADQRSSMLSALEEVEDWLYGKEGDTAAASEYRSKLRDLRKEGDAARSRAREMKARPKAVKLAREVIDLARKSANTWAEIKPWLNATEVADFVKVVDELDGWLNEKEKAQEGANMWETPVLTGAQVNSKVEVVRKLYGSLNTKKAPPPPPPPPSPPTAEKNETEAGGSGGEEEKKGEEREEGGEKHDEL